MYFRRLDPVLRQSPPRSPRAGHASHEGASDGGDVAAARAAKGAETDNDASATVSPSKRKRKTRRQLMVGKETNKNKRLKIHQQQREEEEFVQQTLADRDHDAYEEDDEIFDCIRVANGRLMIPLVQKAAPDAGLAVGAVPPSTNAAPPDTRPATRSNGRLAKPVVAERSLRLAAAAKTPRKVAGGGSEKRTRTRKKSDGLRQSLLPQSYQSTPSRDRVTTTEDSSLSELSEAKAKLRVEAPSSKKSLTATRRELPVRGVAKKSEHTQTPVRARLGAAGLGANDKATRSAQPPRQQPSTGNATNVVKAASASTARSTATVAHVPITRSSASALWEIPGTPEDAVTPPSSTDEKTFGDTSARKETSQKENTQLEIRPPSPRTAAVTSKPAAAVSTEVEMPRNTRSSRKKNNMHVKGPPQAVAAMAPLQKLNGSPPTPAADGSLVSALKFNIRKFPGDPKTISITGSDIYDPRTSFLSYDALVAFIGKEWPVDSAKQQLFMNWTFRLMDQEAFDHCIVQLCKHGRKMHEIVLCDLDDGKLPEGALKIQAGLKQKDKLFWQGKHTAKKVEWSLGEILDKSKGKRHSDVQKVTANQAPAEKRRQTFAAVPTGGANRLSDTTPAVSKPKSHPRSATAPESEPPVKRRAVETNPASITTRRVFGNGWPNVGGAGGLTGRFIDPLTLFLPSPSRWRSGNGKLRVPAATAPEQKESTLENETFPVEASPVGVEPKNNLVPADVEVATKPVAADCHMEDKEVDPQPVAADPPTGNKEGAHVEKQGSPKGISKEPIQPGDPKAPNTPLGESPSVATPGAWGCGRPLRMVPLEGCRVSTVSGFSVVQSQPQCSSPIVLQPEQMTGLIAGQNAFRAIRTHTQPVENTPPSPVRPIGTAQPHTPSPCASPEPTTAKSQSSVPPQTTTEGSTPVAIAIPASSTCSPGAPPTPKAPPVVGATEVDGTSTPGPMDLDGQPETIKLTGVTKTPPAARSAPGGIRLGEETTENLLPKEVPEVAEPPVTSRFVAVNSGVPSGTIRPQSAGGSSKRNGDRGNAETSWDNDPTIDAQADLLLRAFFTAHEVPTAETNAPVAPVKRPTNRKARRGIARATRLSVGNAASAPEAKRMMSVFKIASPTVGQANPPDTPCRMSPVQSLASSSAPPPAIPTLNPVEAQQRPTSVTAPAPKQPASTTAMTAIPQPVATEILNQPLKRTFEQATSASTSPATVTLAAPASPTQPVPKSGSAQSTQPTRRKSAVTCAQVIPTADIPRPQPYRRPDLATGLSNQVVPNSASVAKNSVLRLDQRAPSPPAPPALKTLNWAVTSTPDSRKRGDEQQRRPAARLDPLNRRPDVSRLPLNKPCAAGVDGNSTSNNGGDSTLSSSNYGIRPLFTSGPIPRPIPRPPAYAQPRADEPRVQRVPNSPPCSVGPQGMPPVVKPRNFYHYNPSAAGSKSGPSSGGAWKLPILERTGSPNLPLSLPSPPLLGPAPGPPLPLGPVAASALGPPRPLRTLSDIAPAKPRDMVFTIHRWDAPETRLCLEGIHIMKDSDNNRLSWAKLSSHCAANLRFDDYREALIINWCTRAEDQESLDKGHDLGRYNGRGQGNEVVVIAVDDDTRRPVEKEVVERLKWGKRAIREQEEGEAD